MAVSAASKISLLSFNETSEIEPPDPLLNAKPVLLFSSIKSVILELGVYE